MPCRSTKAWSASAARVRVNPRPVMTTGRRLAASACSTAETASDASTVGGKAAAPSTPAAASEVASAVPTSSGKSRCTGPGGSAVAMDSASVTRFTTSSWRSGSEALVMGAKRAWWSMRIWMRRSSHRVGTLHVMAMSGAQSSHAHPTPVDMLVAPGPSVERQTPGVPVRLPMALAMKPAEVSLAVRTYLTDVRSSASISGSTGPLGTPKTHLTPAASSERAMRSTFFIVEATPRCRCRSP